MANTNFAKYDTDGLILFTGCVPDTMLGHQGENIYVGDASGEFNYIVDGELRTFTEDELKAKSTYRQGFTFKMPERILVDTRSLEEVRVETWERIKAERDHAELKPFSCGGNLYDPNILKISGAVQMVLMASVSGQPFSIDWTLHDNSVVTLSGPEMFAVGLAMGQNTTSIYDSARLLRIKIKEATTVSQLDSLTLT